MRESELEEAVRGRAFLVLGGAGTIGTATLRALLRFRPSRVDVVDLNENGLAELVRSLRSSGLDLAGIQMRFLALDAGSPLMEKLISASGPYTGGVLSFMALKHVRSEKDPFTLQRMLATNVLMLDRVMTWLQESGPPSRLFAVSTDKAARPASLMGASKRVMEGVLFGAPNGACASAPRTSTRFANVAFSSGSLLESWRLRIELGQALACPEDTRRFFVTPEEAGMLCLLSALSLDAGYLAIPSGETARVQWNLLELAERFLEMHSLTPRLVDTEDEARALARDRSASDPYPLLVTPRDTGGEKEAEVFVGSGEVAEQVGFREMEGVRATPLDADTLAETLRWVESISSGAEPVPPVEAVVERLGAFVPGLAHRASDKNLDQRM